MELVTTFSEYFDSNLFLDYLKFARPSDDSNYIYPNIHWQFNNIVCQGRELISDMFYPRVPIVEQYNVYNV